MSWPPRQAQVIVRHLLAEAIRASLTTEEPVGDAVLTTNVVEAINRLAEAVDRLAVSLDNFRIGQDDD
jgi:hypothetical protein